MISVSRKTHMPSVEAPFCCSMSSNWWTSAGWWSVVVAWLWDNGDLLLCAVMVRLDGNYRGLLEVMSGRRRSGLPFQPGRFPGIVTGYFAIAQRPQQINQRQDEAHGQHRSAGAGEHIQHLEFFRIRVITSRHSQVSQDELREERKIETDEGNQRRQLGRSFRIHAPGYLGPPEMESSYICRHHATHHHVMEMGDHEISIVDMNVQSQGRQEKPGEATDGEQADEGHGIKHGRIKAD